MPIRALITMFHIELEELDELSFCSLLEVFAVLLDCLRLHGLRCWDGGCVDDLAVVVLGAYFACRDDLNEAILSLS